MTTGAPFPTGVKPQRFNVLRALDGGWRHSLSVRLFWLTISVILLVELIVFVPSAGSFREEWLSERAEAGRVASLAVEASPSRDVSRELSRLLSEAAMVQGLAELDGGVRYQILPPMGEIAMPVLTIDMREKGMIDHMMGAMGTLFSDGGRTLLIVDVGAEPDRVIEVLVPETGLKQELFVYACNILLLSLLISMSAGALVFSVLYFLLVKPLRRVTRSVEQFRDDPGAWTRRLPETARRDEIGRAQNALSDMEGAVSESFRQRERLAELGEAVARINHDLRGSLASAQLVSDSLARSEDPRVQRAAPRLERALERAITLATQTLQYGKASAPQAELQACVLADLLQEAAMETLGETNLGMWTNEVPRDVCVTVDADHMHRIAANLIRNAKEAMGGEGAIRATFEDHTLYLQDNGPGLPDEIADNLFKPFASRGKRGGTGLGLAIARDLAKSMDGNLRVHSTSADEGTCFALSFAEVTRTTASAAE